MNKGPSYSVIVVGAGLAGCSAALHLASCSRVLLVDAVGPGAGASGMAWGLADPLRPRRARPIWRADESIESLERLVAELAPEGTFGKGIIRPAQSPEQARFFRQAAQDRSDLCRWVETDQSRAQWPWLRCEHGVLEVTTGTFTSLQTWTEILCDAAISRGVEVRNRTALRSWTSHPDHVEVHFDGGGAETCSRLLLCLGDGFHHFPALEKLNLHRVKGQVLRLARPASLDMLPAISGDGYVVGDEASVFVGSTYEHTFDTASPTDDAIPGLRSSAARLVPDLENAALLSHDSRVRVTVPGIRLPMVGPLPNEDRVWVFTALGSKGILMSALLGRELPGFFRDPSSIPPQNLVPRHA